MKSLHEQTREKAFCAGQKDLLENKPYNSEARKGSMWDVEYSRGFNQFSDCGCRFESADSNAVVLCEACSQLPCHNKN